MKAWIDASVSAVERGLARAGFVGSYLHGSLASGGWLPPKSDVDLIFVVDHALDPGLRERVALACVDAAAGRPTIGMLELSVVRRAAALAGRFPMPVELHFGEDDVEPILGGTADYVSERVDADLAVHVRSLHESGVALSGPPVDQIFAPVPEPVFRAAVDDDLEWILEGEHILETPVYGVLNLCRGLWLERCAGEVTTPSKPRAGAWALTELPSELRHIVGEALDAHADPAWIAPDHRRTAGRVWDVTALLEFRDRMRVLLGRGTTGPRAEPHAGSGAREAGEPATTADPDPDAGSRDRHPGPVLE